MDTGHLIKPLITSANPAWLDAMAIKGRREPFQLIGSASSIAHSARGLVTFEDIQPRESIDSYVSRDPWPIPLTADREGYYGDAHYDWWLSGLHDYLVVGRALAKFGCELRPNDSVFELGCASGRVLRHFACQRDDLDVWGADINLRHVEWIRNFLSRRIKIFQNTALPHLPLEGGSFSLVTAFSVFTHVDELELAWLVELRRILKPGGVAYVTIHSERTWNRMRPGIPAYDNLFSLKDEITDYPVSENLFRSEMPLEKVVFYWGNSANYNSIVFHHTDYIRSVWGRFFEIRDFIAGGHNYQDVVVLQRK